MDVPLLVRQIAERAEAVFGDREIVSRTQEGVERSTYAEIVERARRLASALRELGIGPGDRVATFGWNSLRHLELYLAVPSMGAVLHTLNIRLFEEDLRYIVGHAEDRVILLDASLAEAMPSFEGVEHEILMPDGPGERDGALSYEELVEGGDPGFAFPDLDENTAAAMCYTSGTTGRPKGVVYSHRSTVLHSLCVNQPDAVGLSERDSIMPVVPMFHANAWGLPYAAALAGARQVFPGPKMTPADLAELIVAEGVTRAAGVPTIWQGVLALEDPPDLSCLERGDGGRLGRARVADPRVRRALGRPGRAGVGDDGDQPARRQLPRAVRRRRDVGGRPLRPARLPGPHPAARGLPHRRGGRAASSRSAARSSRATTTTIRASREKFTEDGWLRTGDVAELRHGSFIKLVDRTKDLVKSGGEWISSVELENEIMAHPDVLEAAVIAVPDEKWSERPCACVVMRDERDARRRRDARVPRGARGQVVAARSGRVHRRGAQDVRGQVRQEGPARPVRRAGVIGTAALVSDLHLGQVQRADLLRRADVRASFFAALEGVDELVLLGDVVELREGPVLPALRAARPFFEELGEAMAGRRVVLLAGNHDHRLIASWLERRRTLETPPPLGLAEKIEPGEASEAAAILARWLGRTPLELSYPGVWVRDDVYATHGHYLDRHVTIPGFEPMAIRFSERLLSRGGGRPRPAPKATRRCWDPSTGCCTSGPSPRGPAPRTGRARPRRRTRRSPPTGDARSPGASSGASPTPRRSG